MARLNLSFAGLLLVVGLSAAQNSSFSLYPTVDPDRLASAFNISVDCLDALNTTLPCDQTLLTMAGDVDNYWWEQDNMTDLCTYGCFNSVQSWFVDVETRCAGDSLVSFGKQVPAESVAGRYYDGIQVACLTNGNSTADEDPAWCLLDSQEWVGSDVARPDCSVTPSDPACADPTAISADNSRLANLYHDNVLCSECFVQMMRVRLSSQYLPDQDYSDYLVSQYQDILDVCHYWDEVPPLVVWAPPNFDAAIPPAIDLSNYTSTGCTGQTIVKSTLDPNANCATIAQAFNVATGAVQAATGSDACLVSTSSICLPAACTLFQVPSSGTTTCDSLAKSFSTSSLNVTATQFLTWNPTINGLCDALAPDEYVCKSPPGGSYIPPPPAANSSANDAGQSRGGGNSAGSNPNGPGDAGPQGGLPRQAGIVSGCTAFQTPASGVGCFDFATGNGITPAQLYTWNPVLGAHGENCTTQFWLGYAYCIRGPGFSTTTSSSRTSTSTGVTAPGPTQTGITSGCTKFAKANSGEVCTAFASRVGITTAQLYAWNTVLGANGENCASSFWADEYYCVAGPAVVTTTTSKTSTKPTSTSATKTSTAVATTTKVTPPGPTQTGIAANCNKYAKANSGEFCSAFATRVGISEANLYKWNTVLGTNGANCGTLFWADEYYCVGVGS
ncbi:carbohydrate-binding module family 50 protein [Rhypophila decipiens]|uniref:Carbohydrate-binding module family 50 protein n=1 Tax=Rhypophila decipiens TaxID=261697 RepID=A0AAN7B5G5_9PEZI|nr:carbohydrate-binding module family 50 protein [Rhypophila decipiens]